MRARRYPSARWKGDGRRYGTLTSKYPLCVVFHSTETASLPGYDGGNSAPHLSYDPRTRIWIQHQDLDAWVGALRRGNGPISANAKAIQVEIICYSDKAIADQYGRLWIGNLTDGNYADLSGFVAWLRVEGWLPSLAVWMPAPSWRYGTASPYRMPWSQYLAFDGITAHGGVPDQTHWNTGVLDLYRIAAGAIVDPWPDTGDEDMWSTRLDEQGWRALARAGIALGGEENVVNFWWTNRAHRTPAEHVDASRNMSAAIAVRLAQGTVGPQGPPGPAGPPGPQGPPGPKPTTATIGPITVPVQ